MNSTAAVLDRVVSDLDLLLCDEQLAALSDADRLDALRQAGAALRRLEATVVETVATAEPEFAHSAGCRNANELLQRVLVTDAPTAGRLVRAAGVVRREVNLVSGERMPARWPELREAMLDGTVGVAGLLAATGPVDQAGDRIRPDDRLLADVELANRARGCPVSGGSPSDDGADAAAREVPAPPATPEDLKQFALLMAMLLDPDGAEPSGREAQNRRFVTIGRLHRGGHRLSGSVIPEVAAQLQLIFDAYDNPRVDGAPAPGVVFGEADGTIADVDGEDPFNSDPRHTIDPRTPAQKRHDALAAALGIAARHHDMPTLAGAAPTLVVHVDVNSLHPGEGGAASGWATLPDGTPIPANVAAHTGCTGVIQRVLFDDGRIVGISTIDRVFTVHQRRAIIARDRECLIPGCHVPHPGARSTTSSSIPAADRRTPTTASLCAGITTAPSIGQDGRSEWRAASRRSAGRPGGIRLASGARRACPFPPARADAASCEPERRAGYPQN